MTDPDRFATLRQTLKAHGEDAAIKEVEVIEEELKALEGIRGHADRLEGRLEDLSATPTPLAEFEQAIQAAHHHARHLGLWNVCPHPICRELEDWILGRRKGA